MSEVTLTQKYESTIIHDDGFFKSAGKVLVATFSAGLAGYPNGRTEEVVKSTNITVNSDDVDYVDDFNGASSLKDAGVSATVHLKDDTVLYVTAGKGFIQNKLGLGS